LNTSWRFAAQPDLDLTRKTLSIGDCSRNAVYTLGIGQYRKYVELYSLRKSITNELLTLPNQSDQVMFWLRASLEFGAVAGATIYFGSEQSTRQIQEVSCALLAARAHELGMVTAFCYL